jgi:hypothetical protein
LTFGFVSAKIKAKGRLIFMKQRSGFVSNSSSSSFIVAFSRGFVPNKRAIVDYLFKGQTQIESPYPQYEPVSVARAASDIWAQLKTQTPNDEIEIKAALTGYLPGEPELFAYTPAAVAAWQAEVETYHQNWWQKNKHLLRPVEMDLYVLWFSDNDGPEGVVLEHGYTLAKAPYLWISHH